MFRRPKFFQGRKIRGQEVKDIMWFNPGGTEMTDEEWNSHFVRCLGMLLSGKTIDVRDEHGEPIVDDTFLVLFNAHHESQAVRAAGQMDVRWGLILDTAEDTGFVEPVRILSGRAIDQAAGSFAVPAAAGRRRGELGVPELENGLRITKAAERRKQENGSRGRSGSFYPPGPVRSAADQTDRDDGAAA